MTAPVATRPRMDPRIGRRRAQVTRDRGRRRLRLLLAAMGVVALLAGALAVLHSPLLSAKHVKVVGDRHTTRATLLRAAGLSGAPPLIDVDSGAAEARLEALPWVGRAVVARQWPDSLLVRVTERVPLVVMRSGATTFLVDASGRVLARIPASGPSGASAATAATAVPSGLPVLSAPARPGAPGTELGPAARPGLAVAAALAGVLPGRAQGVSVGPRGDVVLDLGGGVRASLGPAVGIGSKLAALASVLAGAPPKGPELIDVSVPGEPTVAPQSGSSA